MAESRRGDNSFERRQELSNSLLDVARVAATLFLILEPSVQIEACEGRFVMVEQVRDSHDAKGGLLRAVEQSREAERSQETNRPTDRRIDSQTGLTT